MTTALEQQRIDQELGAAWRRVVAALPERADLMLLFDPKEGYIAEASRIHENVAGHWGGGFDIERAGNATAAEALARLADALEAWTAA